MSEKDLKDKAITVQGGKQYVLVSDRIIYFNEHYKNGAIRTELLSSPEDDKIAFKAIITPDTENPSRSFTGHSQATVGAGVVNKTSAMENAETSAIGRALGLMGIGVIDSIASHDEMVKAGAFAPRVRQESENDYSYESTGDQEEVVNSHFCMMHQKELKERESRNGGKYYDHRMKIDDVWNRCDGTGWKV